MVLGGVLNYHKYHQCRLTPPRRAGPQPHPRAAAAARARQQPLPTIRRPDRTPRRGQSLACARHATNAPLSYAFFLVSAPQWPLRWISKSVGSKCIGSCSCGVLRVKVLFSTRL